jgi:hypothetical protein
MTTLEEVQSKIKELSAADLRLLQEQIEAELRQKTSPPQSTSTKQTAEKPVTLLDLIPGAYRPTKEQIEAHLAAVFTSEERARMGKTDFSKLPVGAKTVTEMISEDREDRF